MIPNQEQIKLKLTVEHSFSEEDLSLTFSGSENAGVYNLLLPRKDGGRHHWRDVPLKSSEWKILCNTVRLARLDELPIEEPESEWMVMDGSYFTLNLRFDGKEIKRTRHSNPERRFCVVVNKMVDLVPQLDDLKDFYKFRA